MNVLTVTYFAKYKIWYPNIVLLIANFGSRGKLTELAFSTPEITYRLRCDVPYDY